MARKGDLIVVNPRNVGGPAREGEIIEVIERDLRVQYRVRWNDGHESLFAPGAGAARIEPARDQKKTRSEGTAPKKSPAKASTAKNSAAKKASAKTITAKKLTAKKSTDKTAKKSAAKKSAAKKSAVRKVAATKAASRGPIGRR
ncbi:MAG: DUF1918 domain-containing protein [Actinomycetota bacterium]|nr:DUF1918 domain-containing protein [Actinomycetota bacterium]